MKVECRFCKLVWDLAAPPNMLDDLHRINGQECPVTLLGIKHELRGIL